MSFEALPIAIMNVFGALFHGLLFVVGFIFIRQVKSWPPVFGITFAVALIGIAITFASFFLHGPERALDMINPSGEMFAVMGLPVIINSVMSATIILFAAYGLFVAPGNKKNV